MARALLDGNTRIRIGTQVREGEPWLRLEQAVEKLERAYDSSNLSQMTGTISSFVAANRPLLTLAEDGLMKGSLDLAMTALKALRKINKSPVEGFGIGLREVRTQLAIANLAREVRRDILFSSYETADSGEKK